METENKKLSFNQVLWYIIIFSLLGLIAEAIYGYAVLGIMKFEKGLVLGPLCICYGIILTIIVTVLRNFKGKKIKIFIIGTVIGTVCEYFLSFLLEAILGVRFWNIIMPLNLNGRICLLHSICIGIISVILIEILLKWIDKLINKINIKSKAVKIINIILIVLIVLEVLFTCWGIIVYRNRAKDVYNEVKIFEEKNFIEKIGENIFTDKLMSSVYPRLRFVGKDGNIVMINSLISTPIE